MKIVSLYVSLRNVSFAFVNFFVTLERLRNEDIYSSPDNFPTGFYTPKYRKYAKAFQLTFSNFVFNIGFGGVEE